MKRVLLILVVLAVFVAGAYLLLRSHGIRGSSSLVPSDTVLYFSLPDTQRSLNRWPKTSLAQIASEPEVADFLAKPMQALAAGGGLEAMDQIFRVKPARLFLAVTAIRKDGPQILIGFQFFGGRKNVDAAMERFYQEIGKKLPNAKASTSDHDGDTVTTFAGGGPALYSASHGDWAFISNHQDVLNQALDRAAGRKAPPALDTNRQFQTVFRRLSDNPDFRWYGDLKSIVDLLLETGSEVKAEVNENQLAQMRKLKAMGGTLLFDGENQRELTFFLISDAAKLPPIDRSPMAFTTPETSVFFDGTMDTQTVTSDDYFASLPPAAQTFLTNTHIDLKQLPGVLGNDYGLIVSWPPSAMIPNTLLAVEIKDRAGAQSLVQSLLSGLGLPGAPTESNGATVFRFPTLNPVIDPSVAVTDKFVLAALTGTEMDRALSVKPGAPTLESTEAFKPALESFKGAGQAFGYVDSKALFERMYMWLRMAMIASAFSPTTSQYIDVQKMPDTETISNHLSPILYTTQQTSDGLLIESSGPITLGQVFIAGLAGGVASYMGQMATH